MRTRRIVAVIALIALVAAGCSSDDSEGGGPTTTALPAPSFEAFGGTGQLWLQIEPEVEVALFDAAGEQVPTFELSATGEISPVDTRTTDENGALVMRYVEPGEGYVVKQVDDPTKVSNPVTVTSRDQHPEADFYAEHEPLVDGYQYITTRDGTRLAANVTLPGPIEDGPYPTVIEYSGYDPASPSASLVTIGKTLASTLGYATVGVNIRGSGCSGGSFQLWEDPQAVDGYDVIETVAAQDWVKGGQVGMVGVSYPAGAMLYTAALQPPSLAAIAPLATYDDGFRALLWPGGIQNEGFARAWVEERDRNAEPLAEEWTQTQVDEGDEICAENMELRGQNVALSELIDLRPHFPTEFGLGDTLAPYSFADDITAPTYLVATWQDEQVGGHVPTLIEQLDGVEHLYVDLLNGNHTEGLVEPSVLQGWVEFLDLYVAEEVPDTTSAGAFYPTIVSQVIQADASVAAPFPANTFADDVTYEEALAQFEERDRVRLLLDNGGAEGVEPGVPLASFDVSFDTYPAPGTEPTTLYLGADGTLVDDAPTAEDDSADSIDAYVSDPSTRPATNLEEGSVWAQLPDFNWTQPDPESSLSYVGAPLTEDVVMMGSASADLWVRSSEADTDVQVTLTEVRPDGQETFIQTGRLRASKRALDEERSTELQPLPTMLETDAAPLPEGEFTEMRIEIYPFAHAFRAGSRIRIVVSAPGGDMPEWSFINLDGTQDNEIARSAGRPSKLVLPVLPGVEIPTPLPPCPGLRGQPCRPYTGPPAPAG